MRRNGPLALIFHTIFVIVMVAPILVVCLVAFTPEGSPCRCRPTGFRCAGSGRSPSDREIHPRLLGQSWPRRAVFFCGAAVRSACGVGDRALSLPRSRRARSIVPVATDDPTRRARHRLPALLYLGRHGRQFRGADHRACHHRVSVRTTADACGGDQHGFVGRDGRGLARCRRLDAVPPRDAAADFTGRHQRLGARLHPVLRRSHHDRLSRRTWHRDIAGAHVPLHPGQHRSAGDVGLGLRDRKLP